MRSSKTATDAKLTNLFLDMLAAEQGAGVNTLDAYRRDLTDFSEFLGRRDKALPAPEPMFCGTTSPTSTPAASNPPAWRAGCRRCGICSASS